MVTPRVSLPLWVSRILGHRLSVPVWALLIAAVALWFLWPRGQVTPVDDYDVTIKDEATGLGKDYISYRDSAVIRYIREHENNPASVDIEQVRTVDKSERDWIVWYRAHNEYGALVTKKRLVRLKVDSDGTASYRNVESSESLPPDPGW